MSRTNAILVSSAVALTLAVGVAFAQGGGLYGRPDPEIRAAVESLDQAMVHLQNARNADLAPNARARAFIALAMTELDPGYYGLRRPLLRPE